ncbi:hypothetical protein C5F47_04565 [Nitrosopumilus cobalaminigenes]|uniref:Uncharacterized protein n=2 Tax=Nitrosopumilus cobalaminigenes TaxID=1470066 RepID=A0A7D5M0J2_9ARCH|nr:hypothetical protein C5F47_04565 [Nitrosopumilus cobalaminigenes]
MVIAIVLILLFVIVGISIALPPLLKYADDEARQAAYNNVPEKYRMMCNTPSELEIIFDRMDTISSDNLDTQAKGIYQSILWGNDIESCDVLYLYNQLDDNQKEKLLWLEISCTVSHCIP